MTKHTYAYQKVQKKKKVVVWQNGPRPIVSWNGWSKEVVSKNVSKGDVPWGPYSKEVVSKALIHFSIHNTRKLPLLISMNNRSKWSKILWASQLFSTFNWASFYKRLDRVKIGIWNSLEGSVIWPKSILNLSSI